MEKSAFDEYYYLTDKYNRIEELQEILKNLPSISGEYDDLFSDAYYEFVLDRHCSYEFTQSGISLLNSETEDMDWTIDDFVKSGCKTWKEFSVYLADEIIQIFEKYLSLNKNKE